MSRIVVLQPHIANRIAAGEVVERPASIVKELVENAVDAGSTAITVEIQNGGIDSIRVSDNGVGIPAADCLLAFERHATSKLSRAEDLDHIETLGFRGEALASIAAVAQVRLTTRAAGEEAGTLLRIEGGECREHRPHGCPEGTTFQVENVFYNVPARRRFLKAARTEAGHIADYLSRMILARPDISFKYVNNGAVVYHSPGDDNLRNALFCVYGAGVLPHIRELGFDDGYLRITGYLGTAEIARPNRTAQSFLLNGRFIRSALLSRALQQAYDTRLMGGRFPFAVVSLRIASGEVDVNVHPNKLEVRFANELRVENSLLRAAEQALQANTPPVVRWGESGKPAAVSEKTVDRDRSAEDASIGQSTDKRIAPESEESSPPPPDLTQPPARPARVKESGFAARLWERAPVSDPIREAAKAANREPVPEFTIRSAESQRKERRVEREEQQDFGIAPYAIAGQVFDTYWIVQQGDSIFFIDQHAAHERILYERFMQSAPETASQGLLAPEIVTLTPEEQDCWERFSELLRETGFDTGAFGPMTVRVDAVPAILTGRPIDGILRDILALLARQGRGTANDLRKEAIIQASCKHAVKGGDPLTAAEIEELLSAFRREGAPMTCPHGRPVMVQMSRRELEKQFKRIL